MAKRDNSLTGPCLRCGLLLPGEKCGLDRIEFSDNLETDDDPGFVDAAGRDFRLREDSAVLRLPGWEKIPIERIGLYNDEYRTDRQSTIQPESPRYPANFGRKQGENEHETT